MPARSLTPLVAALALAPLAAADGNLFTYYSFAGLSTAPGDNYDMARCLDGTPTGIAVRPGRGADAAHFIPAPDDTVGELARRSEMPGAGGASGGAGGEGGAAAARAPEPEIVISYAVAPAFA